MLLRLMQHPRLRMLFILLLRVFLLAQVEVPLEPVSMVLVAVVVVE